MEAFNEALLSMLSIVLTTAIGVLIQKVVKWLNEKGVTETLHKKKYLVDIAVHAAEQLYKHADGAEKLNQARTSALNLLRSNGLDITSEELDAFIEDAVQEINRNIQKVSEGTIEGNKLTLDNVVIDKDGLKSKGGNK